MSLPNDVARCTGAKIVQFNGYEHVYKTAKHCLDCLRYLEAKQETPYSPQLSVYVTPSQKVPCPMKLV